MNLMLAPVGSSALLVITTPTSRSLMLMIIIWTIMSIMAWDVSDVAACTGDRGCLGVYCIHSKFLWNIAESSSVCFCFEAMDL